MGSIKKILLLTPGQPSSNPRLLKEAICLSEAGYKVTVLYCFWAHWAHKADELIKSKYSSINWIEVGGNPYTLKWKYLYTRIRQKLFLYLYQFFPGNLYLAERSELRAFSEMMKTAKKIDADLYIAHNLGVLAVAGRAAAHRSVSFAFDAEDFHRGQASQSTKEYQRTLILENFWIPKATYLSAASPLIAAAYENVTGVKSTVINNVFSRKYITSNIRSMNKPIRLFWFSQSIGRGRGLEDVISALQRLPKGSYTLTLMGDADDDIKTYLYQLIEEQQNKKDVIRFLEPVHPDLVFSVAESYDIGLALEPGRDKNNQIALSNKIFTYLLAGQALILSATPAQKLFYDSHPEIGWLYPCGNVDALVKILCQISENRSGLMNAKSKARELAIDVYNWEKEKVNFLNLVGAAIVNE